MWVFNFFLHCPYVNNTETFKGCVLDVNINQFGSKLEHIILLAIGLNPAPESKRILKKKN